MLVAVSFARLRLKTAFLFDTCIAVGQISGLLVLAHFGLLSASRAFWVIGRSAGLRFCGGFGRTEGSMNPA